MLIQGQTSEFSLPELFKFLKDSQQSGRLCLRSLHGRDLEGDPNYLWFEKGQLVAASQRLDGLGLLNMLQQRCLLKNSTLPRLLRQCPPKVALGQFLWEQSIINVNQLQSLFSSQILRSICTLLQVQNVRFSFYPSYPFPYLEMTGIKIQATDITLPSLRMIKSWGSLIDKLPGLDSGLKLGKGNVPKYRLNSQEATVLRLAEAGNALSDIATLMDLPKLDVQKIGFRLIFVGLASEIPLIHIARATGQAHQPAASKVSKAFLNKLSNFLQQTAELTNIPEPASSSLRPPLHKPLHSPLHKPTPIRTPALALQAAAMVSK